MNARLKQLAQRGGMDLGKVQSLVDLYDGNEAFVEQIILGAASSEKAAIASGIAYKALKDDGEALDALDQAYIVLRNALDTGDEARIETAVENFMSTVDGGGMVEPSATLEDSGDKSKPAATKRYNPARDAFAVAVGADQAQAGRAPRATKHAPLSLQQLIEASLNNMGDLH